MHVVRTASAVLVATVVVFAWGRATAGEYTSRDVKPTREWSGSAQEEAQRDVPADGLVTNERALARLWQALKPGAAVPAVDFQKDLVLVQTTRGSRLRLSARLSGDGDLKVTGFPTGQQQPGLRYQVVVVSREGVVTVNDRALPRQ
jgi:hypothetical protein